MIHEIQGKTLLSSQKQADPLFNIQHTMNIYRGCEHQCVYCDSRSLCYGIENFRDVLVKVNAIELLEKELPGKRKRGPIGTGSMSDPYTPADKKYRLTGSALKVIARHRFPIHMITKSDRPTEDIDALRQIPHARVTFSISTVDDALAKKLEPGAPPPSARLAALAALNAAGVEAGVALMPVLPFIEDDPADIEKIILQTARAGGRYILPWFGLSMRDRQREHLYAEFDRLFPGMSQRYARAFGSNYSCPSPRRRELEQLFQQVCARVGVATRIEPPLAPSEPAEQLRLF